MVQTPRRPATVATRQGSGPAVAAEAGGAREYEPLGSQSWTTRLQQGNAEVLNGTGLTEREVWSFQCRRGKLFRRVNPIRKAPPFDPTRRPCGSVCQSCPSSRNAIWQRAWLPRRFVHPTRQSCHRQPSLQPPSSTAHWARAHLTVRRQDAVADMDQVTGGICRPI